MTFVMIGKLNIFSGISQHQSEGLNIKCNYLIKGRYFMNKYQQKNITKLINKNELQLLSEENSEI